MYPVLILSCSLGLSILLSAWVVTRAIRCRESTLTNVMVETYNLLQEHLQLSMENAPGKLADEVASLGARIAVVEIEVGKLPSLWEDIQAKTHRAAQRNQKYLEAIEKREEEQPDPYPYPQEEMALEPISGPPIPDEGLGWEEKLWIAQHGGS